MWRWPRPRKSSWSGATAKRPPIPVNWLGPGRALLDLAWSSGGDTNSLHPNIRAAEHRNYAGQLEGWSSPAVKPVLTPSSKGQPPFLNLSSEKFMVRRDRKAAADPGELAGAWARVVGPGMELWGGHKLPSS